MFKQQEKEELKNVYNSINSINKETTNIKVAIHTLERLGLNVDEYYKLIDNLGIELVKLRRFNEDFTKNCIK